MVIIGKWFVACLFSHSPMSTLMKVNRKRTRKDKTTLQTLLSFSTLFAGQGMKQLNFSTTKDLIYSGLNE